MGASHYYELMGWQGRYCPQVNMGANKKLYSKLHKAMMVGLVASCHDISEGGMAVTLSECLLASGLGAEICFAHLIEDSPEVRWDELLFSESPGRFVVSVAPKNSSEFEKHLRDSTCIELGQVTETPLLICDTNTGPEFTIEVEKLKQAWLRTPLKCWPWEFNTGEKTNGQT
jgi:phosphoribosylformylglycinamidine synthase